MEPANQKVRILYLFPGPTYNLQAPHLRDRFGALSEYFEGEVYCQTPDPTCSRAQFGEFLFQAFVSERNFGMRFHQAWFLLKNVFCSSKKKPFNVVICYDPVFAGMIGCLVKFFWGYKLIIEINNSDTPRAVRMSAKNPFVGFTKYYLYRILIFATCSYADRLKVLSKTLRTYVPARLQHKVVVFHDYVPTHYFDNKPVLMDKFLLFVGYPYYRKGIDVLIKAFENVADRFPDFELRLVGHALEEEAKQSFGTCHRNIRFMKPMGYSELMEHFYKCYCFVLASREEGLPRVLIEAMACSKPLIGTNVGGVADLIDGNGYLVPPDDQSALADALADIMSDEVRAKAMGEKSREIVTARFSSECYKRSFLCMINNLLEEKKRET